MQLTICCPEGGDFPIEARLARVLVAEGGEAFVEFPCPRCGRYVACPLEVRSAIRLIALGLRAIALRAPAEVTEVHEGPPLGPDDLLDLHLFLGRSDWLEELERELGGRDDGGLERLACRPRELSDPSRRREATDLV